MKVHFYKFQATGNDFILMDNRDQRIKISSDQITNLCDRKFGIGGDGLMLLEQDPGSDFKLQYFNRDGSTSLCGNGSRAAVQLAKYIGLLKGKNSFVAIDGMHAFTILDSEIVKIQIRDVQGIHRSTERFFLHTGSPHVVKIVQGLVDYRVVNEGKKIRWDKEFQPEGTNVNFVELLPDNSLFVRTFERGVEDETLSCGTGITAAALVATLYGYSSPITVKTRGGDLSVEFQQGPGETFTNIYLAGPAKMVFEGDVVL